MATLNPGSTSETRQSSRLVVELSATPDQRATCRVETRGTRCRHDGKRWIVEADGVSDASATISIVATTPGSPMQGSVDLVVISIQDGGDSGSQRQEWNVDGVVVEGRSEFEILRVHHTTRGTWELENLMSALSQTPTSASGSNEPSPTRSATADPYTQSALREWGDRVRIDADCVVAVDRSASMGWAFAGGAVDRVLDLVAASVGAALSGDSRIRYCTYGSALDRSDSQVLSLERVPGGIKAPGMYSSTAVPAYAALAKQNASIYVLVTDEAPGEDSHALLAANGGQVFTLVVHGGDPELDSFQADGTHSVGFPPTDGESALAELPEQSAQSIIQFLSLAFERTTREQGVLDAPVE